MSSTYIYPPNRATLNSENLATREKQDELLTELTLDVVDFSSPALIQTSTLNIPASASAPVVVNASLAAQVRAIRVQDTTGEYIGIYSDPGGTPVLEAIIGPGMDSTVPVRLAVATAIGLRNMKNATISVGDISMEFLG